MSRSAMFVSEEKKASISDWYQRFRARVAVPTEARVVDTTFGKTHALIAGPKEGEPLVVLHGALASSAHVLPELGHLLETRRVYALDIVGQSVMSEDRRIEVADDSYGRWVVEATRALGLGRYDLFGVSWGGFVALRAAKVAPERVRKLVLLVPAGWVGGSAWEGLKRVGLPMLMLRAFPSEARLRRVFGEIFTTMDADWMPYFGEALRSYRMDMRVPPVVRPGELDGLSCPVLIFGADDDVSFPGRALIARAQELLPQAEVELLEGSKHCPPLTEEFRAMLSARIERFLDARGPLSRREDQGATQSPHALPQPAPLSDS